MCNLTMYTGLYGRASSTYKVPNIKTQQDKGTRVCYQIIGGLTYKLLFNPLSPHDVLKHHFTSLKTYLIFPQLRVFKLNFIESGLPIHGNFLYFFTHIKSSSSTTSRELRQQFAACSGWRWEWKNGLERVNTTWKSNLKHADNQYFSVRGKICVSGIGLWQSLMGVNPIN